MQRNIKVGSARSLQLRFDAYNVFNSSPIIQYNTAFASWLTPQRIMDGRLYKLSAQISF